MVLEIKVYSGATQREKLVFVSIIFLYFDSRYKNSDIVNRLDNSSFFVDQRVQ